VLSTGVEHWLERVYELTEAKGRARVADIADALEIARPSVSVTVRSLTNAGLLHCERDRGPTPTAADEAAALGIRRRRRILSELLTVIGVPADNVERDVEGTEHPVSGETLEKIETLPIRLRKQPERTPAAKPARRRSRRAWATAAPTRF